MIACMCTCMWFQLCLWPDNDECQQIRKCWWWGLTFAESYCRVLGDSPSLAVAAALLSTVCAWCYTLWCGSSIVMSFCWIKKARKHCFGEDTHLRCLAMFCVLPSCSAEMLRAVDDCKQWILERHSCVFHKRFDVPCDFACSGVGNMNFGSCV